MKRGYTIPRRIYKESEAALGEHARNVQEVFNRIADAEQRVIESLYEEPMTMLLPEEPFSLELVRIVNMIALETPVTACNGLVHWVWRPLIGGAQITKLGGMDVATHGTTRFRFYYRVTYRTVS